MSKNLLNKNSPQTINLSAILGDTSNSLEYKEMTGLPTIITLVTNQGYRTYRTPKYAETAEGRIYNFGDIKNYKNRLGKFSQAPAFLVQIANTDFVMLSKENFDKYKHLFLEKQQRINQAREKILLKIESAKKTDSYKAWEIEETELPHEYSVDKLYNSLPDIGLEKLDVKENLGI